MANNNTNIQLIERRTYLKGTFKGTYCGILDKLKSSPNYERYYDLEVIEGEIYCKQSDLRMWQDGDEFEEFIDQDKFLTKLPASIKLYLLNSDNKKENFIIKLNDAKLKDFVLTKQSYEDNEVFGIIEGEISGYLKHFDEIEIYEDDDPLIEEDVLEASNTFIKTDKLTGNVERKGNYIRYEKYFTNGKRYWDNWELEKKTKVKWTKGLNLLFSILFLILFLIPLFYVGLPYLAFLGVCIGFILLFRFASHVIGSIFYVIATLYIGLMLFSFFSIIYNIVTVTKSPFSWHKDKDKNKSTSKREDRSKSRSNAIEWDSSLNDDKLESETAGPDSLIINHRIWNDYNMKQYEADIIVRFSDYINARKHKNQNAIVLNNKSEYDKLVDDIYDYDHSKLGYVYQMFDSIRRTENLSESRFAELIITCIQDIPYTFIFPNKCDFGCYDDDFIQSYLSNGGVCEGGIKYGLNTPVEFAGNLLGDCDTRTLLLFTILRHFNFDVAMLSSEVYRHSVIGINLPYKGIYKLIRGSRYYIVETTIENMKPGEFPYKMANMRYWNTNLITQN
jgi:predicted membrane protein